MNRFASLLNSINDRLDVPQPVKSRILLEIAADLEDAYEFYRAEGHSDEEATRLTQEKFILDDQAINELIAVHQPFFRKWVDQFSLNLQSRWERVVLVLTILSIAVLSGRFVLSNSFINNSIFVWPIWGMGFAGIVLFFIKFYRLYLVKDHHVKTLRKGIDTVGYVGAFSLALGFAGYFYELLRHEVDVIYPGGSLITVVCTVPESREQMMNIYHSFVSSSTVMMASLLTTMFLALFWFVLHNKATQIEMAEAKSLLLH